MDRMWKRPNNRNSNSNNPPSPYVQRFCKSAPCSPAKATVKKTSNGPARADTPYVKAKHAQLVDKEPDRAIALFWAAINAGDRVDSALKDMAVVMKQQNRPEEAIEAIKSLRNRCSDQAQESLDNLLLDLYKRCGRMDDRIALLKHKLNLIHQGLAFNGKRTKTARSQGKKFQLSIGQEATRLLGNLGWAYMQQSNYIAAEAVYRKALSIELDNNKMCNLGICLMHRGRGFEAKSMLQNVKPASANGPCGLDSHLKSYERAQEMLRDLEGNPSLKSCVWQSLPCIQNGPWKHIENPISVSVDWDVTALNATSGFGPFPCSEDCDSDGFRNENVNTNNRRTPFVFPQKTEDGFGNENVNINNTTPFVFPQKTEILKQRLDKICLENETRPYFIGQNLQNEARPFPLFQSSDIEPKPSFLGQSLEDTRTSFVGHHSLKNETRPATRRSLSWDALGFIEAPDSNDLQQIVAPA
ncbi:hypothetical protein SUGI_0746440 [Cryptomeria japonica]|uniref:protein POLLENLESS 3-LIKE 2 n=1 Tax=Cryptomeria japonica TaxID=3369 RepID=UPI002414A8B4|nr:protein POLLENLESS 3-LIKE 2 [Cryptomeria japonica]GLJ36921.1 hypothetical protein SUGI_0746440 [Cryptomeria japonica]